MKWMVSLIIFGYITAVLLLIYCVDSGEGSGGVERAINHRQKRYLAFRNVSRFFVRFNFKADFVPWTRIFSQALGFRMNFDDPPDSFHKHHRIYRRDLYNNMEIMLDKHGFHGYHCIRRAICEVNCIDKPDGIYQKILKIVFRRQSTATDKWHGPASPECELSTTYCPFSFLDVALYTDV